MRIEKRLSYTDSFIRTYLELKKDIGRAQKDIGRAQKDMVRAKKDIVRAQKDILRPILRYTDYG